MLLLWLALMLAIMGQQGCAGWQDVVDSDAPWVGFDGATISASVDKDGSVMVLPRAQLRVAKIPVDVWAVVGNGAGAWGGQFCMEVALLPKPLCIAIPSGQQAQDRFDIIPDEVQQ